MDENGNEEIQGTKVSQNEASVTEDFEAIEAQLKEEKKARAALEESLPARDARIAELESQLSEAKAEVVSRAKELEASAAELATTKEARDQAVAKYLEMVKASNPTIPEDIISGETIEEIDQSIVKGKTIVEAVRAAMESEAAATKVPAGAPTRGGISLEGMSPREKIAYGIQQKGGI